MEEGDCEVTRSALVFLEGFEGFEDFLRVKLCLGGRICLIAHGITRNWRIFWGNTDHVVVEDCGGVVGVYFLSLVGVSFVERGGEWEGGGKGLTSSEILNHGNGLFPNASIRLLPGGRTKAQMKTKRNILPHPGVSFKPLM